MEVRVPISLIDLSLFNRFVHDTAYVKDVFKMCLPSVSSLFWLFITRLSIIDITSQMKKNAQYKIELFFIVNCSYLKNGRHHNC